GWPLGGHDTALRELLRAVAAHAGSDSSRDAMSRPGRPPRSQQRPLTREDEALWKSVARTLEPVQKKSRIHTRTEPAPGLEDRSEVQMSPAFADKVTSAASAAPPRPLDAGQRFASRPQVHKPPPL